MHRKRLNRERKKKEWVMCMPNENDELCLFMLLKGLRSE